jgi:hypothetical protein
MVIVELTGGLGNQMFQYAFGRSFAERYNTELKLDISFYESQNLRSYSLDCFNITETFATDEEVRAAKFDSRCKRYTENMFRLIRNGAVLTRKIEQKFCFDKMMYNAYDKHITGAFMRDLFFRGFWQSEKYFLDITNELRREFVIKSALSDSALQLLAQIRRSEAETVSLHIRRGDYISNAAANQLMGELSIGYYQRALQTIGDKIKKPLSIFIFSDDIGWVKQKLCFDKIYNVTYVESDDNRFDYEDMYLMSQCKHHIIANSTYSWWGAWLDDRMLGITISPKKWFKDNTLDYKDIVPSRWTKIDN